MMYFLYESSLGLCLFKANEWDKIATQSKQLQKDISNFGSFKKIVSLEASFLFHGHGVAHEILSKLKANEVPEELTDFLKTNLPSMKKGNIELAVQEKNLASLLNESMKLKVVCGETQNEIFRGIRTHIVDFLSGAEEGVTEARVSAANLGIGHSFARHNI